MWLFGMVERSTNHLVLYPVEDRTRKALLPIIQRHVTPESRIFSDGWSAYLCLNDVGYERHKHTFTQV